MPPLFCESGMSSYASSESRNCTIMKPGDAIMVCLKTFAMFKVDLRSKAHNGRAFRKLVADENLAEKESMQQPQLPNDVD